MILDWVPAHFPTDEHGLAQFDGTALYEHADPRRGFHPDWNTAIYDFGRREVVNVLVTNALYWLDRFHVDGLRVDAVASMLYLDYSRKEGEWLPNESGGNENLEAVASCSASTRMVYGASRRHHHRRGIDRLARRLAAGPRRAASASASSGTWAGCTTRWSTCSASRSTARWHHNELTFGLLYAFSENFVLPLSHDEVVHGKGSLLAKMPGDDWQKFANPRAYYGFMWGYPGKKLLFMGQEFGQGREWNFEPGLDWHLLDRPLHTGSADAGARPQPPLSRRTGAACARLRGGGLPLDRRRRRASSRSSPGCASALGEPPGRRDLELHAGAAARLSHRPAAAGRWREILNTDADDLWRIGYRQSRRGRRRPDPASWLSGSAEVTLPPLATIYLTLP